MMDSLEKNILTLQENIQEKNNEDVMLETLKDIEEIEEGIEETDNHQIVDKVLNISLNTLEDSNANSREIDMAENLFVLTSDFKDSLDKLESSDINEKEKKEIEDKIEGEVLEKAGKTVKEMVGIFEPDANAIIKGELKDNLESFLEDVDVRKLEIVDDDGEGNQEKVVEIKALQENSKNEILRNIGDIRDVLSSSEDKMPMAINAVQIETKDKISELFDELEENKLDVEAANLSLIDKTELEKKLDSSFVNEVIEIVEDDQSDPTQQSGGK